MELLNKNHENTVCLAPSGRQKRKKVLIEFQYIFTLHNDPVNYIDPTGLSALSFLAEQVAATRTVNSAGKLITTSSSLDFDAEMWEIIRILFEN